MKKFKKERLDKYKEKLREIQKQSYEIKNNITSDAFGGVLYG